MTEEKLARHVAAIEAGVDPKALVAAMTTAQAETDSSRALELEVRYHPGKRCAIVGVTPCGVGTGVRRGT